ncbi:efflux RND transporter periplasmic adaptor subunit [Otariodibacter oris]|uniref:Membrane fusion protein (Multidrug efflux system) n=1 Tax=Otariodibacter oris TaxID=1032623 RepID=A0A420XHZ8_9PAST|nr:efflux RND transporter periplasmic adaptor subunit [Otariodibacter oris]QGM81093.1 efflux transporter periplasmic adaptor subunit [Otariodibacter oris]RKR76720.1 membrane fusion protein (multidrug efflux system) [Otariodibacter oris]
MTLGNEKPSVWKRLGFGGILLFVILVFVGVIGFNMFIAQQKRAFAENMPEPVNLVTADTVVATDWTPTIDAVGYIRPKQGTMLSSQINGTVSQILVKAGDQVKKGQLLVELDSSVEKATLKVSEAQLPAAKANYERFRSLIASRSASKSEFDAAQANYNQLLASIESLKATIQRRQIYAPFDGVAGIVKINEGQFIPAGTEIVRVEDRSEMKVNFSLPQTDLARIGVGQAISVLVDAFPNQPFSAKIIAIDPAVDNTTGLVEIEALVKDAEKLYSGMFARVEVLLPIEKNQVVIPQIAVTYTMYGETVYVLDPLSDEEKAQYEEQNKDVSKMFRARQLEVKTVDRQGLYAQISSGVKIGDTIVTGGFQKLRNNSLVEVSDKKGAGTTQPERTSRL